LKRSFVRASLVLLGAVAVSAHVGSPDVYYSGKAGPYLLDVVVKPPTVVPGVAQVLVHTADARVSAVTIRPVYWRSGSKGAPTGDDAKPVAATPGSYAGQLWLMAGGSYSVDVTARGSAGSGTVTVPVVAVATGQLALSPFLRALLVILGSLLVAGIITAIHVAAGESLVAPGEPVPGERKRGARRATFIAVPVMAFLLLGGARWWNSEAANYRKTLYTPMASKAEVHDVDGAPTLDVVVTDRTWASGVTPVMPDHGKMAHMFVIGAEFPFAFAHLHPAMPDRYTFRSALPPLPPGKYRVFTDVVHESGFERTLVDSIVLPAWLGGAGLKRLDADESWSLNERVTVASHMENQEHNGGFFMRWQGGWPVYAETPGVLLFSLSDIHGNPPVIEPYLGMEGHAAVVREDGKVFIHLHPSGTASMASQMAFDLRNRGDTAQNGRLSLASAPSMDAMAQPDTVRHIAFPYAFPSAGRYRVYVQVRANHEVHTTAFDVEVRPRPSAR
jgi:hypothetical protein